MKTKWSIKRETNQTGKKKNTVAVLFLYPLVSKFMNCLSKKEL